MITIPRVSFGLYALTLKQDSTPSCSDLQSFAKITDLKTDNATSKPYATYEPDYWLLDGGYKFMPTNAALVHVGLMSASMSDGSGIFATAPSLIVDFGTVHDTDGIALRFANYSNDYASSINVKFYDAANAIIRDDTYVIDDWEFSTGQAVTNFKKIQITFYGTNKPYRYLRVTGIDYGTLITFEGTDILECQVIEQIDPISATVPVNSLELSVHSSDAQFSIINPTGDYVALQDRQPLAVYQIMGNDVVFIGSYYLDNWESQSDTVMNFSAVDQIGVLNTLQYDGGIWLDGSMTVSVLIASMFEAISTPYDLDPDLADVVIIGWIPACSYREALQEIAFAIGAYVTCARIGLVGIYKTVLASDVVSPDYELTDADLSQDGSPLALKKLVTGVQVTAHNYVANTTTTELFNASLAVGTHKIVFDAPVHDLSITGATISSSGANYAIVSVAVEGTVVLTGQGYTDTKTTTTIENTSLDANVKKNILTVPDATLVHPGNVSSVTQRIYDYYGQRYIQKTKLYASTVEVGRSVSVEASYDRQVIGVVEKMDIDLANGMIASTEITGVVT